MGSTITGNSNDDNSTLDIKNALKEMDKGLKLWQGVISFLILLITVVTLIVNQSNKIETQALRINYLESSQRDNALILKEMNQKLTDILITLQTKEDKRK
jgi:hypothetical protein